MELHSLDQSVFCGLGNLEVAAAQGVVEGYGRGLAADDSDSLCRLRLILVIGKLRHSVGAGEQVEINCAVLTCRNRLIDAIAGDRELDTLNLAVLAGFHDMADALGFRVQLEVEEHRVFRAGSHRLLAGAAPNEHLAHTEVGFLLCRDHHGIGNHVLAGEGILIPAAGDGNAAGREIDIGQGVIGVGQGDAVIIIRLIVLHRVGLCIALIAGREARYNIVLGHLLQDPVVAFLGRSALDGVVVHIRIDAVVGGNGGRTGTELLLILPNDALRSKRKIIIVRSGNGGCHALMITVHQRHHNSELCGNGQVLKILAVLAAGGIVGVAVIIRDAALDTVHMVLIAVAVDHHILILGVAGAVGFHIETAVIVIEDGGGGRLTVEVVAVRAEIFVSVGGGTLRAFLDRPCECARGKHRNDHENGQKCRKQSRALGFKNSIHLDSHPFILIKKKPSAISAEDFVLVVVS